VRAAHGWLRMQGCAPLDWEQWFASEPQQRAAACRLLGHAESLVLSWSRGGVVVPEEFGRLQQFASLLMQEARKHQIELQLVRSPLGSGSLSASPVRSAWDLAIVLVPRALSVPTGSSAWAAALASSLAPRCTVLIASLTGAESIGKISFSDPERVRAFSLWGSSHDDPLGSSVTPPVHPLRGSTHEDPSGSSIAPPVHSQGGRTRGERALAFAQPVSVAFKASPSRPRAEEEAADYTHDMRGARALSLARSSLLHPEPLAPPEKAQPLLATERPTIERQGSTSSSSVAPSPASSVGRAARITLRDAPWFDSSIAPPEFVASTYNANSACEDRYFAAWDDRKRTAVMGVLDGHGGAAAAEFFRKELPRLILQKIHTTTPPEDIRDRILSEVFSEADESWLQKLRGIGQGDRRGGVAERRVAQEKHLMSGACANVAVIKDGYLTVANAGDCRCVLATAFHGSERPSVREVVDRTSPVSPSTPQRRKRRAASSVTPSTACSPTPHEVAAPGGRAHPPRGILSPTALEYSSNGAPLTPVTDLPSPSFIRWRVPFDPATRIARPAQLLAVQLSNDHNPENVKERLYVEARTTDPLPFRRKWLGDSGAWPRLTPPPRFPGGTNIPFPRSFSAPTEEATTGNRKMLLPKARREPSLVRVGGSLLVTRALGDAYLKRERFSISPWKAHVPLITCKPEVWQRQLRSWDLFFVMASDGVWDLCTNGQVVQAVMGHGPANSDTEHSMSPVVTEHVVQLMACVAECAKAVSEGESTAPLRRRVVELVEQGVDLSTWSDADLAALDLPTRVSVTEPAPRPPGDGWEYDPFLGYVPPVSEARRRREAEWGVSGRKSLSRGGRDDAGPVPLAERLPWGSDRPSTWRPPPNRMVELSRSREAYLSAKHHAVSHGRWTKDSRKRPREEGLHSPTRCATIATEVVPPKEEVPDDRDDDEDALIQRAETAVECPAVWGGVRWTSQGRALSHIPLCPEGSNAAERVIGAVMRTLVLSPRFKPEEVSTVLRVPAGDRRKLHDDMTCMVVFLPGARPKLTTEPLPRGQRRIDHLLQVTPSASVEQISTE
jgi:serine/threonine protein phosphatase PrpC